MDDDELREALEEFKIDMTIDEARALVADMRYTIEMIDLDENWSNQLLDTAARLVASIELGRAFSANWEHGLRFYVNPTNVRIVAMWPDGISSDVRGYAEIIFDARVRQWLKVLRRSGDDVDLD